MSWCLRLEMTTKFSILEMFRHNKLSVSRRPSKITEGNGPSRPLLSVLIIASLAPKLCPVMAQLSGADTVPSPTDETSIWESKKSEGM
jgi:hypothetical protein